MEPESDTEAATAMERHIQFVERWSPELSLRKYLLLAATLFVMVTYSRGFNPPGGVWQDTGEPIIRDTNYIRYAVFFYCNASAFASSLLVVLLLLFLVSSRHEKRSFSIHIWPLRVVVVVGLLSFMMAYAAGSSRDTFTTIYSSVMVGIVFLQIIFQVITHGLFEKDEENRDSCVSLRPRKVLMLLAAFMVSVTYVAGLSTPGGHHLGYATLQRGRLTAFFVCNTTAFAASLLIMLLLLLDRDIFSSRSCKLYGCVMVALTCLVGAYAAGSCREAGTTAYVAGGCAAAVLGCVLLPTLQVSVPASCWRRRQQTESASSRANQARQERSEDEHQLTEARFNVVLLATLTATITYQAGLDPPGGVWQDNGDDAQYLAGDPILLTASASRYTTFFYCNSVAFVASLVSIVLVQKKLLAYQVLKVAVILNLFGLIGAYAAGSCREVSTSIHVMILAGAVLSYVVIHIIFLTRPSHHDCVHIDYGGMERRRKHLLLFAILATTVTYQAGLTPPGGFNLLQREESANGGQRAGDPVLLHNNPGRYQAFYYINSASFMLSIALIILLLNPKLYKLAFRCHPVPMSVCAVAGMLCLMAAYAAGSNQHLGASISIIVLLALVLLALVLLIILFFWGALMRRMEPIATRASPCDNHDEYQLTEFHAQGKKMHASRKYLMLLGILVTTATYQAGLHPPGGVWQRTGDGHDAGNPMMHDNRRHRYLAFFYCNSASFAASIAVILLLLVQWHKHKDRATDDNGRWLRFMTTMIVLELLALLGGYAAGSSRSLKSSAIVLALVAVVLLYFAIHFKLSRLYYSSQAAANDPLHTFDIGEEPPVVPCNAP